MNKTFPIVKKGYDPQQVDTYIAELEEVIKSYKEKDVAIKNALVNAQIAADNIVKNAEIEADTYKLKAMEKLVNIKKSVSEQKNHLDNFKNDYNRLIQKYLKDFNDYELVSVENKVDELSDYIDDVISDKHLDDFEQTKVVKSIKKEYHEQFENNNLITNGESIKITPTEDGILLRPDNHKKEEIKENSVVKIEEAFKDMFQEETPLEPINLVDTRDKNINNSLESYTHKLKN